MRKLDPVRHEEKRQEILAAANRCFERSGLKGASVADICKEAGISPGHLYYYFESKDAIIATLSDAWLSRTRARFERVVSAPRDLVGALVSEIGGLAPKGPKAGAELVFEMLAESTRNPAMAEMVQAHSRDLRALIAGVLREGQRRGDVRADLDVENVATVAVAMVDGLKTISLREPGADQEKSAALLRQMLQWLVTRGEG
ncbi:TetR/AcrR family transcriptional regulator [Xanthobacter sp. V4C-4]|uniref:TetR/AcrR family transcriptional regulator n=1 Tax=Xanthobacter cornucopiae TaxID=3119924 RepID=UPI00372CC853